MARVDVDPQRPLTAAADCCNLRGAGELMGAVSVTAADAAAAVADAAYCRKERWVRSKVQSRVVLYGSDPRAGTLQVRAR